MARITSRELSEWGAYFELEPWGERKMDQRFAMLCALIANTHRDTKRKPQPYTPEDYMPKEPGKKTGWMDMLTQVAGMVRAMGGKDLRKR